MKGVKVFTLILFFGIIIAPIAMFNFKSDAVNKKDDTKLAPSPFSESADKDKRWTQRTEEYINDRLGLQDQMLLGYTVVNEFAFHKIVDPSYSYGKDGYVFGKGVTTGSSYGDYYKNLANAIKQMQDYCTQRKVPFLLVFDPSKAAILTKKLSGSVNYDRECVDQFLAELKKLGVNYVDNTESLQKLTDSGTQVFNKKYDPDNWNDVGAFNGTNNALTKLKASNAKIHVNDAAEFDVGKKTQTRLPGTKVIIKESVPVYTPKTAVKSIAEQYKGLPLDEKYNYFAYTVNEKRKAEGSPRALIFSGTYVSDYGHKFYENAFGECVQVCSYQNVLNFPLYYNIFKPGCVIFELEETTMIPEYYDSGRVADFKSNPQLASLKSVSESPRSLRYDSIEIEKNGQFTTIKWNTNEKASNVWLTLEGEYDMVKTDKGYKVVVPTAEKEKENVKIQISVYKDNKLYVYS